MTRFLAPLLLLTACSGDTCDYIGDYTGTFDGDSSGTLTLGITDGDAGEALVEVTLDGDSLSALGDGTLSCEDGELTVTLYDEKGNEIGSFNGSMLEEAGEWALDSGESGTWSFAAG
jgi:hypothetical protein